MPTPYRADHVGSFLRPKDLLEARAAGTDPQRLRELEDLHIAGVLNRQKELGFSIFTDGELRRANFMSDFTDAVSGFDMGDAVARMWQARQAQGPQVTKITGIVTEPLQSIRPITEHELPFLKAHKPGPIKMTLPSASQFPAISFKWGITDKLYKDPVTLLWAVADILKAETARLAAEGVDYIQIDAPRYSYYIDPKWRNYVQEEMGMDPDQALDEAIRADNACLEGAPREGIVYAMHLCRGNNRSQWYAEGGYDPIAEKLFTQLNVDRFLLEYESERAGTFEPLRFLPSTKIAVLGLISSKLAQLEDPAQLTRRIEEASRILPLDNLALSPQCGFASSLEGNLLTEDQQWAKLQLVVDTARQVWQTA